jgi:hypothetical protein
MIKNLPQKIRTTVTINNEGTTRLTVRKPLAEYMNLESGDVLWVKVKCLIKKGEVDAKGFRNNGN